MPIYEYRRPDGSTFEIQQPFSADPLTHDPETGVKVQRVLHAPAVHFKGSGFYNTDYGTRKRQRESAAESSDGSSGSTSGGDGKASDGAAKGSDAAASPGGSSVDGKSAPAKAGAGAKDGSGSGATSKSQSAKKASEG